MNTDRLEEILTDFNHSKLEVLSFEELETLRDYSAEDIASIRAQIADEKIAKPRKHDAAWMTRARTALQFRGLAHQATLQRLAALRLEQRVKNREAHDADFLQRLKVVIKSQHGLEELVRLTELANQLET